MSNDFLPFGIAGGANVWSQATYAGSFQVSTGFQSGIAPSAGINKAIRQATFIASAIAQYVANTRSINVADDGNFAGFVASLTAALGNIPGGTAHEIPYQSAAGTTAFIGPPTASNQSLHWDGSAFSWTLATSGTNTWIEFGNGTIFQFGNYVAANNDVAYTATLPITFPSNHLYAYASVAYEGDFGGSLSAYAVPGTTSNVILTGDCAATSATDIGITYFCVGN